MAGPLPETGTGYPAAPLLAGYGRRAWYRPCDKGALPGGSGTAGSRAVVHDAVVAAAGPGAAGAGAVPGEHLRGGPAVEFHQVPFGAAAVEPGVAEVVPEPEVMDRILNLRG
jgi:hypothetical protein